MIMIKKALVLTLIFISSVIIANAQSRDLEVGVFGGGSYYLGDINPGKHFLQTRFAYGFLARYNLDTRLAVRLSGYRGKIEGDDQVSKYKPERKLKFTSNVTDITAQFEFNFLPYFTGSYKNFVSTYIFGGVSVFFFNPKADGIELRDIGTEGQIVGFDGRDKYSLVGFAIPFGIGVKYSLTRKIGLGIEWGMRKAFTDYLDDISTTYYLNGTDINPQDVDQALSDPAMKYGPYMQRGDSETKDWYSFAGLTITYKINLRGRTKCLEYQGYGNK